MFHALRAQATASERSALHTLVEPGQRATLLRVLLYALAASALTCATFFHVRSRSLSSFAMHDNCALVLVALLFLTDSSRRGRL